MNYTLVRFPPPVVNIIAGYAATYQFASWAKLLEFPKSEIDRAMSENPMAMDVIAYKYIHWDALCENPADWAVDLILANRGYINYYNLARNTNPRAFALVVEFVASQTDDALIRGEIDEMLSTNPLAIALLRSRPRLIDIVYLMWNPAAEELIRDMNIPIDYCSLGSNSAPWAARLLRIHGIWDAEIERNAISRNENLSIFLRVVAKPERISWHGFSANPLAIHHLRASPAKVNATIYSNPAAIEPTISKNLVAFLMELQW